MHFLENCNPLAVKWLACVVVAVKSVISLTKELNSQSKAHIDAVTGGRIAKATTSIPAKEGF